MNGLFPQADTPATNNKRRGVAGGDNAPSVSERGAQGLPAVYFMTLINVASQSVMTILRPLLNV